MSSKTQRSPTGVTKQKAWVSGHNVKGAGTPVGGYSVPTVRIPPEPPDLALSPGKGRPRENAGPGVPEFLIFQEKPKIWIFHMKSPYLKCWKQIQNILDPKRAKQHTSAGQTQPRSAGLQPLMRIHPIILQTGGTGTLPETVSNLPKVTQLVSGRAGTRTWPCHQGLFSS